MTEEEMKAKIAEAETAKTLKEKENFIRVMAEKLEKLEGNRSILNNIFLEIYANPVKNSIEHNYSSPICE